MNIGKLDHVNLRTNKLNDMIDWYSTILGMESGDRPNFPFPGAWLYAGDQAAVHLVDVDGDPGAGSETELKIEHFALSASGRLTFEANLKQNAEAFETVTLQDVGIVQYNIWDPEGNHIHIDFQIDEAAA